jgi:hypothetical protein
MKTPLLHLCLLWSASLAASGLVEARAGHIDILAALHKGVDKPSGGFDFLALLHHKKSPQQKKAEAASSDPTGMLSTIMAASNQALATAQNAHEKAVKQARDQIANLLQKDGVELSHAIKDLALDLTASSASLEALTNSSQQTLARAQAVPSNPHDWDASASLAQARLSSQISFAERTLKKADREQRFAMKDAVSHATQLLEEGVRKLSHKVGDLHDIVEPVRAQLEKENVEPEDGAMAQEAPRQQPTLLQKSGASTDLKAAGAALLVAGGQLDGSMKAGQKKIDVVFSKIEKDLAAGAKAISASLDSEQERELSGVRSVNAFGASEDQGATKKKKKLYHWRHHA